MFITRRINLKISLNFFVLVTKLTKKKENKNTKKKRLKSTEPGSRRV